MLFHTSPSSSILHSKHHPTSIFPILPIQIQMGCFQSKINKQESISLCKNRNQFIKQALSARNLFASAHSSHAMSLRNTGATLSDYALGETLSSHPSHSIEPPIDSLQPPPKPFAFFNLLRRSASMPYSSFSKFNPNSIQTSQKENDPDEENVIRPISNPNPAQFSQKEDDPDEDNVIRPKSNPNSTQFSQKEDDPDEEQEPELRVHVYNYIFATEGMPGPSLTQDEGVQEDHVEEKVEYTDSSKNQDCADNMVESMASEEGIKESVKKQNHVGVPSSRAAAKRGKVVAADGVTKVSLLQIMNKLDDYFLKAFESAQEVSKLLEANRIHYHLNLADNGGQIDYSARVLRAITWNISCSSTIHVNEEKDGVSIEEVESHASVLDKLLAWEKKLYDEVKAGELMKVAYQRNVALLNRLKKRGSNPEALEKTKAATRDCHARYIIDMQSMDETVLEILRLRDDHLYHKLVALADGMAKMWGAMHAHHSTQLKISAELRAVDITTTPKETSNHHHDRTHQFCRVINEWNSQFQKLMNSQKQYIQALNSWLDLNLIPVESSLKKVSSWPHVPHPPIRSLLHEWNEQLEKLPVELVENVITTFATVIEAILSHQQEELTHKKKCEEMRKEYIQKSQAFEHWHQKYLEQKIPASEDVDTETAEVEAAPKDPVTERQFVVDVLKKKVEDEEAVHQKLSRHVRAKSLEILKTHLPELFRAMSNFAAACSMAYKKLQSVAQVQAHGSPDCESDGFEI